MLHARILLYQQVEITHLEAKLKKLDEQDAATDGPSDNRWRNSNSISYGGGRMNEEKKALVELIQQKLEIYRMSLKRFIRISNIKRTQYIG